MIRLIRSKSKGKNPSTATAEAHAAPCCCQHQDAGGKTGATITGDMIVREVTKKYPQTISVFGNHGVDFCCGGAHSIEQTARATGCKDIEALLADLNRAARPRETGRETGAGLRG